MVYKEIRRISNGYKSIGREDGVLVIGVGQGKPRKTILLDDIFAARNMTDIPNISELRIEHLGKSGGYLITVPNDMTYYLSKKDMNTIETEYVTANFGHAFISATIRESPFGANA
ncbi:Uncharacterised protein [uncultured archaeon]|nr:Uncharacterised protein [uncultured archaeon]